VGTRWAASVATASTMGSGSWSDPAVPDSLFGSDAAVSVSHFGSDAAVSVSRAGIDAADTDFRFRCVREPEPRVDSRYRMHSYTAGTPRAW
jgi:hypothetical protein